MGTPERTFLPAHRPSPSDVEAAQPPWATIAWALPAMAALIARMRAIDLAYHVRAGELAVQTGEVVRADPFTFTRGGLPWLNQQWGAQIVYGFAHRLLGWAGVASAHAASIGSGFWFLYRSCVRAGCVPRTG